MNHLERSAAVSDTTGLFQLLTISRNASRTAGRDAGEPPAKSPARRALPLSHSMKVFHWWMASLTALFLFAVPMAIGVIPPMDYSTDDLLLILGEVQYWLPSRSSFCRFAKAWMTGYFAWARDHSCERKIASLRT